MEFVECFVTLKSISNETNYECSVNEDFNSNRISFGNVDLKFLSNQKETFFNDIQCEFIEFVHKPNFFNSLLLKFVKSISEKWFFNIRRYLNESRTGYTWIWKSKNGETGISRFTVTTPISLDLTLQIKEFIKSDKKLILQFSGKSFYKKDLLDNYHKSQHFIFETVRWSN
jgi:hypothetical protein